MDLRLTAAHAVSSEGYIDLVFTSVNLTSPVWKF